MDNVSVLEFLDSGSSRGGFQTDDIVTAMIPLLQQVQQLHENGCVAPLENLLNLQVDHDRIFFEDSLSAAPSINTDKINKYQEPLLSAAFNITAEEHLRDDDNNSTCPEEPENKEFPRYLPHYKSWEVEYCQHHDGLTDIYFLGMLLASMALDLNFHKDDHLLTFSKNISQLDRISERVHPVISRCIRDMTQINRHKRSQDLSAIILLLQHYREQDISEEDLLADLPDKPVSRSQKILARLRKRLYDFSRRNKLIYFKETQQALNLTMGSIPLMLDYQHLKPENILIWNPKLAKAISQIDTFNLSDFLQYEDQPWLKNSLMSIRATSNRCQKEYGFSQLRLAVCFLHWHNLKENKQQRIQSPLLLLPIKLVKKKGIRDSWIVEFQSSEAVINPALRELLLETYGLKLPEFFDLNKNSPVDLYNSMAAAITASEPAVSLNLLDKPRLKLLHLSATKKLKTYQKRSRNRHEKKLAKLEPKLSSTVDETLKPEKLATTSKILTTDRAPTDPYFWEFDLCSITIGNFNYRKMTLVRDYNSILDGEIQSDSFEKVFSTEPKSPLPQADELTDFAHRYHIVKADPTQMAAIDHANKGISYIIQGPPGTGKSQTISNLIADYAARDKRVLFVCEKRAAIDVVYHRLSQAGLKHLCSLIHDSQEDKKEFIMDLKSCYETLSKDPDPQIDKDRLAVCDDLSATIKPVRTFLEHQNYEIAPGLSIDKLLQRLIALEDHQGELSDRDLEELPNIKSFVSHEPQLKTFFGALKVQTNSSTWSPNPFSLLKAAILQEASPLAILDNLLEKTLTILNNTTNNFDGVYDYSELTLGDLNKIFEIALQIKHWKGRNLLFMANTKSATCRQVTSEFANITKQGKKLNELNEKNVNWTEKLNPDETQWALTTAQKTEGHFLRFLFPSWWKLRKNLNICYNFSAHRIKPTWSIILEPLNEEHNTQKKIANINDTLCENYGFDDIEKDREAIGQLRQMLKKYDIDPASFDTSKLQNWLSLADAAEDWENIKEELNTYFHLSNDKLFTDIREKLNKLQQNLDDFDRQSPVIEEFIKLPDDFQELLRNKDIGHESLEFSIGKKAIDKYCSQHLDYKRFDFNKIITLQKRYASLLDRLHKLNAAVIQNNSSARFSEHLKICSRPAAQLTKEQKEFKSLYNKGRKILEHEFSKKMRYKSIRDLSSDEPGMVLKDLKPIWLMSPLSISDTLPLSRNEFDVVIFDEASQILVEEAVPTLYRSSQFIVVGDEMQLPPTNFFSSRKEEEEEEEDIYMEANTDSFLSLAAQTLPSTLLGWHYRSKNELLISFSNTSFYNNSLLTIPEKIRVTEKLNPISADEPLDADSNLPYTLDRPISFHYMNNGVYNNRRNEQEADYIAQLVRSYLKSDGNLSLGIVAFSEAQQGEIEDSLNDLCSEDKDFSTLFQRAQDREDEGQFNGLFVKNLENVQGDERDLIILSICYAPNEKGKMRMNFGPINQSGGEKRLNVIFSRSKRHIALVTSIRSDKITNDYNDGALCLKRYLQYAEAVSLGDLTAAASVLENIHLQAKEREVKALPHYIKLQKCLELHPSELNIGNSHFKAPLAICQKDLPDSFELALLDLSGSQINAALEMGFIRPALLQAFDWTALSLSAKDIYFSEDKVRERLNELLNQT